jgi:SNF2 family DNA or RNA helicase
VTTKQSVAARKLARVSEFAFLASGTPITRDVGGFWSALNVLDIRSFPDQDRFKDRYTDRYHNDYGQDTVSGLSPETEKEFFLLMQGSMRRVAKADVLSDLPDKTYQQRLVQIPHAYRAAYDEMAEDMLAHLPDSEEPLEVMSTLAQLQRLTQLASSACDVEVEMVTETREDHPMFGELVPKYHVTMREPSWKVDELLNLMIESDGEPVVCFAPHTQLVTLAGARAEKAGYRVGYVRGGQTNKMRTQTRLAFQNGELDLLCANITAGGVGLTLTAAHTAVFLERPWAFWQADQAEDRIHRAGQTADKVTIVDIVAENTVEQRVRTILREKAAQLSSLVRDPRIVRAFLGGS